MKRGVFIALALILMACVIAAAASTMSQRRASSDDAAAAEETAGGERWEYLVVSGASNLNLTPSGNPNLRKENTGAFGREAFVLEQAMDKLGARGWELVSVSDPRGDPVYYFKRRK